MNSEPINKSIREAEKANEIVDSIPPDREEDKGFIQKVITGALNGLKNAISWIVDIFHGFVQSVAVLLITTLVIPVIIFFAFIWAIRFLTKRDYTKRIMGYSKRFANRTADKMASVEGQVREYSGKRKTETYNETDYDPDNDSE